MHGQVYVRKRKSGQIFAKRPDIGLDGLMLEIINNYPSSVQSMSTVRSEVPFNHAAFNVTGEMLVASDCHGNLYVFDLVRNRFKVVHHVGVPASCLVFTLRRKTEFLVALADYSLRCYDYESGELVATMRGHDSSVSSLSVHPSGRYALSTSRDTVQLWNLDTFERKRKLNIAENKAGLLLSMFVPNSNSLLTCFRDNSVFCWDSESLTLRFELSRVKSHAEARYTTFAVNGDGTLLAGGGKCAQVRVWSLDSQEEVGVVCLPAGVRNVQTVEFLPEGLYKEDLLVAIGSDGVLRCFNARHSRVLFEVGCGYDMVALTSRAVECAGSPNHMLCVMDSGNVNMYDLALMVKRFRLEEAAKKKSKNKGMGDTQTSDEHGKTNSRVSKEKVKALLPVAVRRSSAMATRSLDIPRLKEILKEYGEFPEKYRLFIWKTLLRLPENVDAYGVLVEKGTHPTYRELAKDYPIRSQKLSRILQRLLSAIAYWTPAIIQTTFAPLLAFPFAKLLQNNQLAAFEVVATVIVSWCQHWFDYAPHPPLNVLSAVENILSYHDKEVFQHFVRYGVTTNDYAWIMLQTGFSEVFTKREWLRLWDHLFINPPAFELHLVVAFSLCVRTQILDCFEVEELRQVYRHQRALVSVEEVIREAYRLMDSTPHDLQPATKLIKPFKPLTAKSYQLVGKFPNRIKGFEAQEKARLRKEEIEFMSAVGAAVRD